MSSPTLPAALLSPYGRHLAIPVQRHHLELLDAFETSARYQNRRALPRRQSSRRRPGPADSSGGHSRCRPAAEAAAGGCWVSAVTKMSVEAGTGAAARTAALSGLQRHRLDVSGASPTYRHMKRHTEPNLGCAQVHATAAALPKLSRTTSKAGSR